MKKEPLISVVIPMYNAERYVEKCIESLVNQTYQNLEIIIVNDGSKDHSKEVCEEYAKKDNRIILINTENRGAGSARNTGIELAKGEYISFIDSDDYVCHDYYERLYGMLQNYGADIAVGRYQRISEHKTMQFINSGKVKEYTMMESLLELYGEDEDKYINTVLVTNKLYKKELFNDIRYPVGRLIDDEFIIYKLIHKCKKVVYTDDVMYAYVQSDSSVMRTNFKEKRVYDTMDVYDEVYKFFKDKEDCEELNQKILIRYLSYCIELAEKSSKSEIIDDKERVYEYLNKKFEAKKEEAKEKLKAEQYEAIYQEFHKIIDK